MKISKQKLQSHGGAGRGQGNRPIANRRVQISVNIPPSMLERIISRREVTGDSLSSTIVWLLDHGLKATEIVAKAIEVYGSQPGPAHQLSVELDKPILRKFEFLKKFITGEGSDIFSTAISELYDSRFNQYIHSQAEELRKLPDGMDRRIRLKNLLIYLQADHEDLHVLKKSLNYLEIPPYGKSWDMAKLRKMFKELSIKEHR